MAKTKNSFSVDAFVGQLATIATTDKVERDTLQTRIMQQQEATTARVVKACDGAPRITGPVFDVTYKGPLRAALVDAKYADSGINSLIGSLKVTIIGITCGHSLPKTGEGLRAYAKRVREDIIKSGDYVPENSGGRPSKDAAPGEAGKKNGTAVVITRQGALAMLCNNDAADMQALDFLTQHHMDKLRALYAEKAPAK